MFKNKKMFIVLLAFILFCVLSTSAFASFDFDGSNGKKYSFPDLPFNTSEYYFFINSTYKNIKTNKTDLSSMIKLIKLKNTIKKDMRNNTISIPNNKSNTITKNTYNSINNPTFFI